MGCGRAGQAARRRSTRGAVRPSCTPKKRQGLLTGHSHHARNGPRPDPGTAARRLPDPSCTQPAPGHLPVVRAADARTELERRLEAANPGWDARPATRLTRTGRWSLDDEATESFESWTVPLRRGAKLRRGLLRRARRGTGRACYAVGSRRSRALIVLGSSLNRDVRVPVRQARGRAAAPGVIVNQGATPRRRFTLPRPWTLRGADR